ncbi:ABC transporter permease [Microbacterium sp. cx-55]|uniref:ABC transporter permease n=1 Tax=Microbacterium sp. cx-55 TaxID=2875948 RepID=UPI001CBDA660|nr:ABC transporter permease [Microbacterium sp. cx-55]MBZ4488059.1 ABC transporter permease [Microbacterium sp. cx-55]UGB34535.1 ABC transporter permease [Microbacterium sp. cx-55]
MKDLDLARAAQRVSVPVVAVIVALIIGAALIAVSGASPVEAIGAIGQAAFTCAPQFCNFATVLTTAAPLIMTALGAVMVLRAGLFSIGQEGQYAMGGLVAVAIGYMVPLPGVIHPIVALLGGAIAGALVGIVPALFRVYLGANELIVSIIVNSMIALLLSFLVNYPMREAGASTSFTPQIDETARLAIFDPATKLGMNIVIALVFVVLTYIYMSRTTWGYEQRMAGEAPVFARYSGMRTRTAVIRAAALGGALAGIGGGIQVLGMNYRVIDGFMDGTGFNGLTAAILGGTTVIGSGIAAIVFASISIGAINGLQILMGIPREIGSVILAFMIVLVAVQTPLAHRLELWLSKRRGAKEIERRAAEKPPIDEPDDGAETPPVSASTAPESTSDGAR